MAGVTLLSCVIYISSNSEKWLKSVYIYGSYGKINTVLSLFWTTQWAIAVYQRYRRTDIVIV